MLINKSGLGAIFVTLKTTFNNAFNIEDSAWQKIAMRIKSTTKQNDYAWLSSFPKMRRWIGEKHIKALSGRSYMIVNENFEATVEVRRDDIEDDNLGIYGTQAKAAGQSAREFPGDLVFEAVNGAFTTHCFDGQYFIDTDHPVINPETGEAASVSNKLTAPLKFDTLANAQACVGAAKTMLRTMKDDEGRTLKVNPNILLVPPALEDTANVLMTAKELEDGKPNPYKGMFEVVVSNDLESATAWFLLDTTQAILPFIFQDRKKPVFVQQTNMDSPDVFNLGVYKFGCEARGASGYGFWQLAVGSTGQG
jgi:phage major head subunit gpT-like protein